MNADMIFVFISIFFFVNIIIVDFVVIINADITFVFIAIVYVTIIVVLFCTYDANFWLLLLSLLFF